MDLKIVILSGVDHLHVKYKKKNSTNETIYKAEVESQT